ncbi:MAG: hypothetical protein P1P88_02395 [Bacteroidales bacterium]|nr:hypothetical protein [Bacteroidales bacterium]
MVNDIPSAAEHGIIVEFKHTTSIAKHHSFTPGYFVLAGPGKAKGLACLVCITDPKIDSGWQSIQAVETSPLLEKRYWLLLFYCFFSNSLPGFIT